MKILNILPRLFLSLTLFSIPFSIRTLIYDQSAYASGIFAEPNAVFLNITEIFLWLTFFTFIISPSFKSIICHSCTGGNLSKIYHKIKPQKKYIFLFLFFLINLLTTFFSKDSTLSLLFSFKIFEGILLILLLNQRILSCKEIGLILLSLGLFEGGLALAQVIMQHDLGLQFLGEPQLTPQTLGVAKMEIGGEKMLRGYGTFLHSNILAAFLVILFFYFDTLGWRYLKYIFLIFLVFTFSRSAFIAIFIGLIIKTLFVKTTISTTRIKSKKNISHLLKKILSLILFFSFILIPLYYFFPTRFSLDTSFFERLNLIQISWQMFLAHPLGTGNANFIFYMQDFVPYILKPWEMQPVHNLYLLILNENGIFGLSIFLIFLFLILKDTFKNNSQFAPLFFALIALAFFDHYFWDLDMGRWLFWLGIGISLINKSSQKNLA